MDDFRNKEYSLQVPGLPEGEEIRLCYVTDLHGALYGEKQKDLLQAIMDSHPDALLCGGDMLIRHQPDTMVNAEALLCAAASEFPVFYAMGNHETRQRETGQARSAYRKYEKKLRQSGVRMLINSSELLQVRSACIRIYGLELSLSPWFKKTFTPKLQKEALDFYLHPRDTSVPSILLAHNPSYADAYFDWGADLTLCGHYHGGVIRFNEHKGLISPQFRLFPPYCCGDFYQDEKSLLVSAGLGDHSLHLRIHNPREILTITLRKDDHSWPSM